MTDPAPSQITPPTAEQVAARATRADKATRGALAGVLGLEAFVMLLMPRAIAFTSAGLGVTRTVVLLAFAGVLVVAAVLVRRPFGIGLGSALQVLFVAAGVILWAMFVVGAIFAAIWFAVLRIRRDLVGTPGDWRMLIS